MEALDISNLSNWTNRSQLSGYPANWNLFQSNQLSCSMEELSYSNSLNPDKLFRRNTKCVFLKKRPRSSPHRLTSGRQSQEWSHFASLDNTETSSYTSLNSLPELLLDSLSEKKSHVSFQANKGTLQNNPNQFDSTIDQILTDKLKLNINPNEFRSQPEPPLPVKGAMGENFSGTGLEAKVEPDHNYVLPALKSSKSVTFADSFGHSLAEVKQFLAFPELDFSVADSTENLFFTSDLIKTASVSTVVPLFFLPPITENFYSLVVQNKVKLESLHVSRMKISGSVLVFNMGFHKRVVLRITTDDWANWQELELNYNSSFTRSVMDFDRFDFSMDFEHKQLGDKVSFCIRYLPEDREFWDNNNGINYSMKLINN